MSTISKGRHSNPESIVDARFASALLASAPAAEIPVEDRIFEPLIGSWNLIVEWFGGDGGVSRRSDGEWHFSRTLEGRAVQDVWIVPRRSQRPSRDSYEYGTSIRFYDPAERCWRSTWIGPMRNWVVQFAARQVGGEIILESVGDVKYRWTFSNVSANAFQWRNELEVDPGKWRLEQRFEARRMD